MRVPCEQQLDMGATGAGIPAAAGTRHNNNNDNNNNNNDNNDNANTNTCHRFREDPSWP